MGSSVHPCPAENAPSPALKPWALSSSGFRRILLAGVAVVAGAAAALAVGEQGGERVYLSVRGIVERKAAVLGGRCVPMQAHDRLARTMADVGRVTTRGAVLGWVSLPESVQ